LQRLGFIAFTEKYFDLTAYQKKGLESIKERDIEDIFTTAIILALNRNGNINLVHTGKEFPNMGIEIKFSEKKEIGDAVYSEDRIALFEININITC
jgi:hypothetical protein